MYGNKMFAVPTTLTQDNVIVVKGNMTSGMLDIALQPDSSQYNIVCKLKVHYSENGGENRILISNIQNGNDQIFYETTASNYFNSSEFKIGFILQLGSISVTAHDTPLHSIPLQHSLEEIRYISVIGEVNELNFIFESMNDDFI